MPHDTEVIESDIYDGPEADTAPEDTPEVEDEPLGDEPEAVEEDEDTPSPELDPEFLEWVRDKDPSAVRKTFDKFTNEWERVREEAKGLEPIRELRDALAQDPALAAWIERYYNSEDATPEVQDARVESIEKRLNDFQLMVSTERELESIHAMAQKENLPDFDDGELLDFAASNRIGKLDVAYKAMKADEIAEARVKAREAEIKANAKAKVETRPKGAGAGSGPVTAADLERMTDAEFLEHMKSRK